MQDIAVGVFKKVKAVGRNHSGVGRVVKTALPIEGMTDAARWHVPLVDMMEKDL
jgi:hypothetical protein